MLSVPNGLGNHRRERFQVAPVFVSRSMALEDREPERRLIAYADFTDYVRMIVRKDNWEQIFRPFFRRKALVQESLQRLCPIRVCAMHARVITQDDELFLMAETVRLLKAMGIKT